MENCIEFKRSLFYKYYIYIAKEEIKNKTIKGLITIPYKKGYKICFCKINKRDDKLFKDIMNNYFVENCCADYILCCVDLFKKISYKTMFKILSRGSV